MTGFVVQGHIYKLIKMTKLHHVQKSIKLSLL